jgi:cytochrome c oxidase accessory protein FixG
MADAATAPRRTTLLEGRQRPGAAAPAQGADDQPLYAARCKVQPQGVKGTFRTIKWVALAIALAVYYVLPFLRWSRGPSEPSQAVLIDLDRGRFYFFFIELWPQEVTYVMGLLILAAFILFFMNAVAGRVWCGYLCPQTVWTDLFLAIERFAEGDRRARLKLDAAPWTADKIWRRSLKHTLWLLVAWWTGGAWVLYFADAPTLVIRLVTFEAPAIAYATIGILTFTTYTLAGHMREQVCTYMCPWPRIQGALTDNHSYLITYRYDRGEPRGSAKKAGALRSAGRPAGDCVDCQQCVVVCPTGIDIRDGFQLECIQCGLCIDACDSVMRKLGRPTGLISYDTEENLARRLRGAPEIHQVVRTRTVLYGALIAIVGGVMLYGLATRTFTGISVLHDRNPLFVTLADGSLRNGYTIRLLNKRPAERTFALEVDGLPGARIELPDAADRASGGVLTVAPDTTLEARVLVFAPAGAPLDKSTPVTFRITDTASGEAATARDHFKAP